MNKDEQEWSSSRNRANQRVHLHTTIPVSIRNLLRELAGDSGRINEVLEEAVMYYNKRKDIPDCEDCEANQKSRVRESLIQSADMLLVGSRFLELLASCGLGHRSVSELTTQAEKIGIEQIKLLRGMGILDEDLWENNFDSLLANVEYLKNIGVLRTYESSPERKTILLTIRMLNGLPELFVIMLLAGWEEAGFTADVEIVADNKVSVKWISEKEHNVIKQERNNRVARMWRDRRELLASQASHRGVVTLSPTLLDWLVTNTVSDPISDKTLISIREFAQQLGSTEIDDEHDVSSSVRYAVSIVGTLGLWELSTVTTDGDIVRVQIRCRTPSMKDLSMKLLRSLLALEEIEEISREEGVAAAIMHFSKTQAVGRKYPRK